MVSVTQFGAVGDGVTDCHAAFVAALAASDLIYVPSGTFYLSATLVISASNKTIYGPGAILGNSALASRSAVISILSASYVTIQGVWVKQNDIASGRSILITNSSHVVIDGVRSSNTQAAFVEVDPGNSSHVTVRNCRHFGGGYGFISSNGGDNFYIRDNVFIHGGVGFTIGDGVEINQPTRAGSNFEITGNYISGYKGGSVYAGLGIGICNASNGVIANNIIDNCECDGIHVESGSKYVSVTGNVLTNVCTNAANSSAGIVITDASYCSVSGNSVKQAVNGHGIMIAGFGLNVQVQCNKVIGNHVELAGKHGIMLSTTTKTRVIGNTVEGANQLNLDAVTGVKHSLYATNSFPGKGTNTKFLLQGNIGKDSGTAAAAALYCDSVDDGLVCENEFSGSWSAKTILNSATKITCRGNVYSAASWPRGSFTLSNGFTTTDVSNTNATDISSIKIYPKNQAAAALSYAYASAVTPFSKFTVSHPASTGTEQFYFEIE